MSMQSFALGMDNRVPDYKLRTEAGYLLRDAVNVDVTPQGTLKRRRGATLSAVTGTDTHSLWASDAGAFYADGVTLNTVHATALGIASVAVINHDSTNATISKGSRLSYSDAPEGGVYWTDGMKLERITDGVTAPIAPMLPAVLPKVTLLKWGEWDPFGPLVPGLREGLYTVLFTAIDGEGRESASTQPIQLNARVNEGEFVIQIDYAGDIDVAVYVSEEGGTSPRFVGVITTGGQLLINTQPDGRECPTYGMLPLPAGQIVRSFSGRTIVASGSILYYSEPYAPGLYMADSGFIPFPSRITIVEPVQGASQGLYVVSDNTYWLAGDFTQTNLTTSLPYGAVEGTSVIRYDQNIAHWMSVRGLVAAATGGDIKNLQEAHIAVSSAVTGATVVMDRNGVKQAVTSLFGSSPHQQAMASSYMDAEIINGATV